MEFTPEVLREMEALICGPSRRSTRRSPRSAPAPAGPGPATAAALNDLIDRLVAESPEWRRAHVPGIVTAQPRATVDAVVGAVVDALLRAESPARGAALSEVLVAFGAAAVRAVAAALALTRSGPRQAVLGGVLEGIGPKLPAGERTRLALGLHIAVTRATDPAAIEALARAIAAVRIADEDERR
ncbi:unnamed protein product [Gemmataceae bacterium]|nr:unnamed protein product [Gemmataceae bacterium]VTU00912.1 unnamed protein product [Gemmataceae bacterium]